MTAKKKNKRGGGARHPPADPKLLLTFRSEGANTLLHLTAKPIEVGVRLPPLHFIYPHFTTSSHSYLCPPLSLTATTPTSLYLPPPPSTPSLLYPPLPSLYPHLTTPPSPPSTPSLYPHLPSLYPHLTASTPTPPSSLGINGVSNARWVSSSAPPPPPLTEGARPLLVAPR